MLAGKVQLENEPFSLNVSVPSAPVARAPRLSRCSCCRPSLCGPSLETARPAAPESSRRIPPGHRRGSDGWRGEGRTLSGTRYRNGCPGRGPSRPGGPRLLPGLEAQKDATTVDLYQQILNAGGSEAHPEVCRSHQRQLLTCSARPPRPFWLSGCLPPPLRQHPTTLQHAI